CGARGVTHDLESTRWVLVALGDQAIPPAEGQREPYIALEPTQHRISGHGGCNRLVGGYELDGDKLRFVQLALTRMACPDMKYEGLFAKALDATTHWKITGNHLELFDAQDAMVARFEERNL
ncbi:MAG TPA: META domain-containing protein, partial [Povalibacter sp.]|nr:META domain-containing protein [Povalibacter sp.]